MHSKELMTVVKTVMTSSSVSLNIVTVVFLVTTLGGLCAEGVLPPFTHPKC